MRTPHTELLGQLPLGRQPLPGMQTARVKLLLDILQDGIDLIVVRRLHFHLHFEWKCKVRKKNQPDQNIPHRFAIFIFQKRTPKYAQFLISGIPN